MSESLADRIARHEGLRLKPYRDQVGKLTIGYGRNLDDKGITKDEAIFLRGNDIQEVTDELNNNLPFFKDLEWTYKAVLIEMCYQLGIKGLMEFKNTLAAFGQRDYKSAAAHMRDSKWYKQVPERAEELARIVETGIMP